MSNQPHVLILVLLSLIPQLGHQAYAPGTRTYHSLITAFGADILLSASPDAAPAAPAATNADVSAAHSQHPAINRRALGAKVFGNAVAMKTLTDIVWPAIAAAARDLISVERSSGGRARAIVLEAAVLLEAGWETLVDEVWVVHVPPPGACAHAKMTVGVIVAFSADPFFDQCLVLLRVLAAPRAVAIDRLCARNQLSADDAAKRLASQMSNQERLARAHVAIENVEAADAVRARVCEIWTQRVVARFHEHSPDANGPSL